MKREEAFARLNLAKINEHWRKILRDVKCRQMKEELTVINFKSLIYFNMQNLTDLCFRTIGKILSALWNAND